MQKLRQGEEEISPTRRILNTLRLHQEAGQFTEQEWADLLACIRDIEVGQKKRCVECEERRLIERL
jgi:hypothetical protein